MLRVYKTLKGKIYEKLQLMIANVILDGWISKSTNKVLFIQYIAKKIHTGADYSALSQEIKTNPKCSKIKVSDRVRITK